MTTPARRSPLIAGSLGDVPALTGLRAFAVFAVLAFHVNTDVWPGGFLGVDVFFVLSGFLITALVLLEVDSRGSLDVRAFYRRRLARLYPALLLGIIVISICAVARRHVSVRTHVLSDVYGLTYLADIGDVLPSHPIAIEWEHLWSLSVEWQFYLVARGGRRLRPREGSAEALCSGGCGGDRDTRRVLASRSAVWLGERSYGFYLFHAPIVFLVRDRWHVSTAPTLLICFVITAVVAAASFRFVERPANRRWRRSAAEIQLRLGAPSSQLYGGAVRGLAGRIPGARALANAVVPSRRTTARQWARLNRAVDAAAVWGGPFAGTVLTRATTGSHMPKRLGSYEAELHPLVESWTSYDTILDVGCGEGWYVVGLARRMPNARVVGFDISAKARTACAAMAAANGVAVEVRGEATPQVLSDLVRGHTLVIVDAEGAEVMVLDPSAGPRLRDADLLVELHDFLVPGATDTVVGRFPERTPHFIDQQPRDPGDYPLLADLAPEDQARALDESRPASQRWVWLPA